MQKIYVIFFLLFLTFGCSKLGEIIWNPKNFTDFDIIAKGSSGGKIDITINRTDHLQNWALSGEKEYFRGYYVYRNESSPYEEFDYIGVDAMPAFPSGVISDPNPGVYTDNCTPNRIYYYRVIVVYRKWENNQWKNELINKAQSSWTAAICPSNWIFIDP